MSHTLIQFPTPPNLPLAPEDWERRYQDQFTNILRLYFTQLSTRLQQLSAPRGGQFLSFPHGSIQRTTDRTFAANTATLITFDTNDFLSGMSNDGTNGFVVDQSGIYNYQYSVQFANNDNQIHTAWLWLRKNTTDIAGTASKFNVLGTHAGGDGYLIGAANFYVELEAGDSVSLYGAVSDVGVYCEAYPVQTTPFAMPSIPSVVATLSFVSALTD